MDTPDVTFRRMLLVDWVMKLGREAGLELGSWGRSGRRFTLGDPASSGVVADFVDEPPYLTFSTSDSDRQPLVDALVARAVEHAERGELGDGVWYTTELREVPLQLPSIAPLSPLLARVGNQTRIVGWRRLGRSTLLEFREDLPDGYGTKPELLAPPALVRAHIEVPGPCAGQLSSMLAHRAVEIVAAVCTFALGRPVDLPPTVFPSKDEDIISLNSRKADPAILTLARKRVPLDFITRFATGDLQSLQKVTAALLTFDGAVRQERDALAAVLFVVAGECLANPPTTWRRERMTKRFIVFFDELIPDALDAIIAHANFEEAFGLERGSHGTRALRQSLLDRIYQYRSMVVHEGIGFGYQGVGMTPDWAAGARRGLLQDFAEAAILSYLRAPRTSLIGHPRLYPS